MRMIAVLLEGLMVTLSDKGSVAPQTPKSVTDMDVSRHSVAMVRVGE